MWCTLMAEAFLDALEKNAVNVICGIDLGQSNQAVNVDDR